MQNYYQFIIPRLNGDDIKRDFREHLSLVRKGIAGFIVFGGRLQEVRRLLKNLQEEAQLPLILASDLERGLGQQLKGGTLFPPAMALARAVRPDTSTTPGSRRLRLLRQAFAAIAGEARYAGINTVLAPVLDINTNPANPIIGVRAFGEDSATAGFFGTEMISTLQGNGIAACGKHFPGHGDTQTDSHISLPSIDRSLRSLSRQELVPFRKAVAAGVQMLMLGHLKVPALDPSGLPVSISSSAVAYLRKSLKFRGILITDAMNMGGLSRYSEEHACSMALTAGVDLLLHPLDADRVAAYLSKHKRHFQTDRIIHFRKGLLRSPDTKRPAFIENTRLSEELTGSAITISRDLRIGRNIFLLIISDEKSRKGQVFLKTLRTGLPQLRSAVLSPGEDGSRRLPSPEKDSTVITAVFSETRAWKGNTGRWLTETIRSLRDRTSLFISFGNPYLLNDIQDAGKMLVYWDSAAAQRKAAEKVLSRVSRR
ncbi:MAG: glycoside hydrolase family 3 N-terminal domain-containing protein [Thermodesulfovibrionales bacterium]